MGDCFVQDIVISGKLWKDKVILIKCSGGIKYDLGITGLHAKNTGNSIFLSLLISTKFLVLWIKIRKQGCFEIYFQFPTAVDENKCLEQIKSPISLPSVRTPILELQNLLKKKKIS